MRSDWQTIGRPSHRNQTRIQTNRFWLPAKRLPKTERKRQPQKQRTGSTDRSESYSASSHHLLLTLYHGLASSATQHASAWWDQTAGATLRGCPGPNHSQSMVKKRAPSWYNGIDDDPSPVLCTLPAGRHLWSRCPMSFLEKKAIGHRDGRPHKVPTHHHRHRALDRSHGSLTICTKSRIVGAETRSERCRGLTPPFVAFHWAS